MARYNGNGGSADSKRWFTTALKCIGTVTLFGGSIVTVKWFEINLGGDPQAERLERIEKAVTAMSERASVVPLSEERRHVGTGISEQDSTGTSKNRPLADTSQTIPQTNPPSPESLHIPSNKPVVPTNQSPAYQRPAPDERQSERFPVVLRSRTPMLTLRDPGIVKTVESESGSMTLGSGGSTITLSVDANDFQLSDAALIDKHGRTMTRFSKGKIEVKWTYREDGEFTISLHRNSLTAISETIKNMTDLPEPFPILAAIGSNFIVTADYRVWTHDVDKWRYAYFDELNTAINGK